MRLLPFAFALAFTASICPFSGAAVADGGTSSKTTPQLDVQPLLGVTSVKGSRDHLLAGENVWDLYDPYFGGGLEVAYRVSRQVALGGYAALFGNPSDNRITILAPEATYHLTPDRVIDVWGSAMLGIAISQAGRPQCGDCGALDPTVQSARFAPITGVGLGVDVYPIRAVSIGLEGRASVAWFNSVHPYNTEVPSSLSPGFLLGVRVGGHIPL